MSFNLIEVWHEAGLIGKGVFVLLSIMSVYSLGLVVERMIRYAAARRQSLAFVDKLRSHLEAGELGEAVASAESQPKSPVAQVVAGKTGFTRPLKEVKPPREGLKYTGMHAGLREMLRFLRTGKVPQTECHDNIKSLAMVFGAMESARKGRRVKIAV